MDGKILFSFFICSFAILYAWCYIFSVTKEQTNNKIQFSSFLLYYIFGSLSFPCTFTYQPTLVSSAHWDKCVLDEPKKYKI